MVHLTYVENPFDKNFFSSLSKYAYEKSFYDCINKRFVDEEAFKNLEYGFRMYMLTGDSNEWIGFVLFSNENRVKSLRYHAYNFFLECLDRQKHLIPEKVSEEMVKIVTNQKEQNVLFSTIDECFEYLSTIIGSSIISLEKQAYNEKLDSLLNDFANYMYLDTFISLPKDEKVRIRLENEKSDLDENELVEKKYYGFIQETLGLVENLIQNSFNGIHIILKQEGTNIFLVETSSFVENHELTKVLINQ